MPVAQSTEAKLFALSSNTDDAEAVSKFDLNPCQEQKMPFDGVLDIPIKGGASDFESAVQIVLSV